MVATLFDCSSVCDLSYISDMGSRLSTHYHCDDLSNDCLLHVDNKFDVDNKIDVNIDSNVAIFWGFADVTLVKETQEPEELDETQKPELDMNVKT